MSLRWKAKATIDNPILSMDSYSQCKSNFLSIASVIITSICRPFHGDDSVVTNWNGICCHLQGWTSCSSLALSLTIDPTGSMKCQFVAKTKMPSTKFSNTYQQIVVRIPLTVLVSSRSTQLNFWRYPWEIKRSTSPCLTQNWLFFDNVIALGNSPSSKWTQ